MNTRPPAQSFEDLDIWKLSHQLVLNGYRLTASFPKHELYGVTSQLRRAMVSVPSNIAEGFKRRSKPDKVRFLNIAQGSLEETRYLLILSRDLGYTATTLKEDIDVIAKKLVNYAHSIMPM
ncbi:MAG TPA: four helix bundle protein [Planctomycetota bacterium]|nr:four helix bundle protein [Planctomycetota bacterium]